MHEEPLRPVAPELGVGARPGGHKINRRGCKNINSIEKQKRHQKICFSEVPDFT